MSKSKNYFKSKRKVKFKIRKELLAIVVGVLILCVAAIVLTIPSAKEKVQKEFSGYNIQLEEDHVITKKSIDKTLDMAKSDEYTYVFFGSLTSNEEDPTVATFNSVNTKATEWEIEELIFVDSSFVTEKNRDEDDAHDAELKAIEDKFNAINDVADTTFTLDSVTGLWVFKSGRLVFSSDEYLEKDDTYSLLWPQIARNAFYRNLPEMK